MDPVIEWNRIDSTLYPTCITGYVVADLGNLTLTISTVTSLTAQQLNAAGFPYCISIQPTVTPLTPMGPLATVVGSSNLTLIDPGMYIRGVINNVHPFHSLQISLPRSSPTALH